MGPSAKRAWHIKFEHIFGIKLMINYIWHIGLLAQIQFKPKISGKKNIF